MAEIKDTTPEVQRMHHKLLMARSNEERFRMGISMCQTARTIVWSSLPDDLDPTERRVQFFLRYYGGEFDADEREQITSHIRSQPISCSPLDGSNE